MKKRYYLRAMALVIVLLACNNRNEEPVINSTSQDSLHTEDSIDIEAASVKSDDYYDNFESPLDTLIGCWAAVREGNITITFSKDSTFEFYDYNSKLKKEELLTGRFELDSTTLTLLYDDRPRQKLTFRKDPKAGNAYRITNYAGYYFLKSHC